MSTRVLPKCAALVSRGFAGRAERSSVEASTNTLTGRFDDVSIKFGGGLEYGFAPNRSAKREYRHIAAVSFELSRLNEARAGGTCRFSGI